MDGKLFAPWGVLCVALLLASCDGSSSSPPPDGTLSGYEFFVIEGEIQQDADDEPITVGSNVAIIAFADPLEDLVPNPNNFFAEVTATFQDGGVIVIGAYGDSDNLDNAWGAGTERVDTGFDWTFYFGVDPSADEGGSWCCGLPLATGTIYAAIQLEAGTDTIYNLRPASAPYSSTCASYEASSGTPPASTGTGDYVGLVLSDVTASAIRFTGPQTINNC